MKKQRQVHLSWQNDRFLSNTTHFGARALFESDKFSELVAAMCLGFTMANNGTPLPNLISFSNRGSLS